MESIAAECNSSFFVLIIVVGFVLVGSGFTCRPREYTTSDGQCCPMCQEGKVVGKDCTAGSGTRCVPCEIGTFMNQPNGLTSCFSCSSCDSGSGLSIKQNCTSISDTVCDVLRGYFCKTWTDSAGCSTAAKHSACKPGQRIKLPGTSRNDTVCENCKKGTFSPHGLNCTLWTQCSESQTKVQEGSSTSDVVCRNGSKRHRYTLLAPFLGLVVIFGLLLVRGSGLRLKIKCSPSSDTVCEALEGYFCTDVIEGSCAAAKKHSSCKPGQYISKAGTSLSDTECSECSRGTFSNGSLTLCQPHTQCSESQTKVQEGSSTSDVVCRNGSKRHRYTLLVPFLGTAVAIGFLIRGYKIHRRFSIRKDESDELQESLLRTELI